MDDNKLPSLVSPSFGKTDEEAKDVKLVESIDNTELYEYLTAVNEATEGATGLEGEGEDAFSIGSETTKTSAVSELKRQASAKLEADKPKTKSVKRRKSLMEERSIEEIAKRKVEVMKAREPSDKQWPFRYRTSKDLQEQNMPRQKSVNSPLLNYPRTENKRKSEKAESRERVSEILSRSSGEDTSKIEDATPLSFQTVRRGAQLASFANYSYQYAGRSTLPAVANTPDFSFTMSINAKSEDDNAKDGQTAAQASEKDSTFGVGLRGDRKGKIPQTHQYRLRNLQMQVYNSADFRLPAKMGTRTESKASGSIESAPKKSSDYRIAPTPSAMSPMSTDSHDSYNADMHGDRDEGDLPAFRSSSPGKTPSVSSRRESLVSSSTVKRSKFAEARERVRAGLGPAPAVGNQYALKNYRIPTLAPEMTMPVEYENAPYYPLLMLSRWLESVPVFHSPCFSVNVKFRNKLDGEPKAPSVSADSHVIMNSQAIQRLLWGAANIPVERRQKLPVTPCSALAIHKVNVPQELYQFNEEAYLETDEELLLEENRATSSFDESWDLAEIRNRAGCSWVYALCPDGTDRPWGDLHLLNSSSRELTSLSRKELPKHKATNEIVVPSANSMIGWPLTEVDFRPWKLSPALFRGLDEFWQTVEVIRFSQLQGSSVTEVILSQISANCNSLRHLSIPKAAGLSSTSADKLLQGPGFINLITLDLSFSDNVVDAVVSSVARHCNHLRSLDLRGCLYLDGKCFPDVATNCSALSTLDISWCPHISFRDLLRLLAACPLQRLACRGVGRGLYPSSDASDYFETVKANVEEQLDSMQEPQSKGDTRGLTSRITNATSRTTKTAHSALSVETSKTASTKKHALAYRDAFIEWSAVVRHPKTRSDVASDVQNLRDSVSSMRNSLLAGEFPEAAFHLEEQGYYVRVSVPVGEGLGNGEWLKQSLMNAKVQLQLSLRRLDLEGCIGVSDTTLISLVYNCKQLEHLRCGHCPKLTAASTTALAVFGKHLKTLNMSYCFNISSPIVDEDITYALAKRARLLNGQSHIPPKHYDNSFVEGLALLIQKGLKERNRRQLPMDEKLAADNDGFEFDGAASAKHREKRRAELEGFHPKWTLLESINFSGCPGIQEQDIIGLLRTCGDLKDFSIEGLHQVTSNSFHNLHENNFNLTSICLRWIPSIDNECIALLSEQCPDLTRIDVTGCSAVSNTAIVALASNCAALRDVRLSFCSEEIREGSLLYLCRQCRGIEVLECGKKVPDGNTPSLPLRVNESDPEDPTSYPAFGYQGNMFLFLLTIGLYCPFLRELDISGRRITPVEYDAKRDGLYKLKMPPNSRQQTDREGFAITGEFAGIKVGAPLKQEQNVRDSDTKLKGKLDAAMYKTESLESLFHIRQDERGPKPCEAIFQFLSRLFVRESGEFSRKQFRVLVSESPNLLFLDATNCKGASVQDVSTIASSRPFAELVLEIENSKDNLHGEGEPKQTYEEFDASQESDGRPLDGTKSNISNTGSIPFEQSSMKSKSGVKGSSRRDLTVRLTERSKNTDNIKNTSRTTRSRDTLNNGTSRLNEGKRSTENVPTSLLPQNQQETPFSAVQPPGFPGETPGPFGNFNIGKTLVDPEGGKALRQKSTALAKEESHPRSSMVGMYPMVGSQYYIRTDAILMRLGIERKCTVMIQRMFRHYTGVKPQLRYFIDRRIRIKAWLRTSSASRRITKFLRNTALRNSERREAAARQLQFWTLRCLLALRCKRRANLNKGLRNRTATKNLSVSLLDSAARRIWKRLGFEWLRLQTLVGRWEDERQDAILRKINPKYHVDGKPRVQFAFPVDGPEVLGGNLTKAASFFELGTHGPQDKQLEDDSTHDFIGGCVHTEQPLAYSIVPHISDSELMRRITSSGHVFLKEQEVDQRRLHHQRVDVSPVILSDFVIELNMVSGQPKAVRSADLRPFLKGRAAQYPGFLWEPLESTEQRKARIATRGFRRLKAAFEKAFGVKLDSAAQRLEQSRNLKEELSRRRREERRRLTLVAQGVADPEGAEAANGLINGAPGAWPANKYLQGTKSVLNPCIRRPVIPGSSQLVPFRPYPYRVASGIIRTSVARELVPGKSQRPSVIDREDFLPHGKENDASRSSDLPRLMGKALTHLENLHGVLGPRIVTSAALSTLKPELELSICNRHMRQEQRQKWLRQTELKVWERYLKVFQNKIRYNLFSKMASNEKGRLEELSHGLAEEKWKKRKFYEWADAGIHSTKQIWAVVLIQTVTRMHSARVYAIKLQLVAGIKTAEGYLRSAGEALTLRTPETLSSGAYGLDRTRTLLQSVLKLYEWLQEISRVAKYSNPVDEQRKSIQYIIDTVNAVSLPDSVDSMLNDSVRQQIDKAVGMLESLCSYSNNDCANLYGLDRGYDLIGLIRVSNKKSFLGALCREQSPRTVHSTTSPQFADEHSPTPNDLCAWYGFSNPGGFSIQTAAAPTKRQSEVMRRASLTGQVRDVRLLKEWNQADVPEEDLARDLRRQLIRYNSLSMNVSDLQDFRDSFHERTFLFQLFQSYYLGCMRSNSVLKGLNECCTMLAANNTGRLHRLTEETTVCLQRWRKCHSRMNRQIAELPHLSDFFVKEKRLYLQFRFNVLQSRITSGENLRSFLTDVSRALRSSATGTKSAKSGIDSRQRYEKQKLQEGLQHLSECKRVLLFIHNRLRKLEKISSSEEVDTTDKSATVHSESNQVLQSTSVSLKRRRTARNLRGALETSGKHEHEANDLNKSDKERNAEKQWLMVEENEIRQCIQRIESFLWLLIKKKLHRSKEELQSIKTLQSASQELVVIQQEFKQKNLEASQLSIELLCIDYYQKNKEASGTDTIETKIVNNRSSPLAHIRGSAGGRLSAEIADNTTSECMLKIALGDCQSSIYENPKMVKPNKQSVPHPPKGQDVTISRGNQARAKIQKVRIWYPPKPRVFRHATALASEGSARFYSIGQDGEEFGNGGFWYWGEDSGEIYGLFGVKIKFNKEEIAPTLSTKRLGKMHQTSVFDVSAAGDVVHNLYMTPLPTAISKSNRGKTTKQSKRVDPPIDALPLLWDTSRLPRDGIFDSAEMVERLRRTIHSERMYTPPNSQAPSASLLILEKNLKHDHAFGEYDAIFGWSAKAIGGQKGSNTFLGLEGPVAKLLEEPKQDQEKSRRKSSIIATGQELYELIDRIGEGKHEDEPAETTKQSEFFPWWQYPKEWKLCWSFDTSSCWGFTFYHHVQSETSMWNPPTKLQHEKFCQDVILQRKQAEELEQKKQNESKVNSHRNMMEAEDKRAQVWREHDMIKESAWSQAQQVSVSAPSALRLLRRLDMKLLSDLLLLNLIPSELTANSTSGNDVQRRINNLIQMVENRAHTAHHLSILKNAYASSVLVQEIIQATEGMTQSTPLPEFALRIFCCFWKKADLNRFQELLVEMQAEADLVDTPEWWEMVGVQKKKNEHYQAFAGGEKYAGSLELYAENVKHQLVRVQQRLSDLKQKKHEKEDVVHDQLDRLRSLSLRDEEEFPKVVQNIRSKSEQYTSRVAYDNFRKAADQKIKEARIALDAKLLEKAQNLFPDELVENPSLGWAKYLLTQRAKAAKQEGRSDTGVDSDEEEFMQWKNQVTSSYNPVGYRGIVGSDGALLLWAGNGAQFFKEEWMERYRVKPWVSRSGDINAILESEQTDSFSEKADGLLSSVRQKRAERLSEQVHQLESKSEAAKKVTGGLVKLRRKLAKEKRHKDEFTETLNQRREAEKNEELAKLTEQEEENSGKVSHATFSAAAKHTVRAAREKARKTLKSELAGTDRSNFFRKKMREQGVIEGIKQFHITCGCFQALDFSDSQIEQCQKGNDYFILFPYNLGASSLHPVYLWYKRTTDESEMIGHMLFATNDPAQSLYDDLKFYGYQPTEEAHALKDRALWYIRGTGRPVTAMSCAYGEKAQKDFKSRGFQQVEGSPGNSPWISNKFEIWTRYAVQRKAEATPPRKDLIKLQQARSNILPLVSKALSKRVQWYRNNDIIAPEKLMEGFQKVKFDLAKTAGSFQHFPEESMINAVQTTLKLKEADITSLRNEFDRIRRSNPRDGEAVIMSTIYRYSGIRKTHLHEIIFLWMDKQFEKRLTFATFLRTVVTFCMMDREELLRFLFYIFALNLLSDVKYYVQRQFFDKDGSRMKVYYWDGEKVWDGTGDRESRDTLPVACFEALLKFILPVNSEFRPHALVAIDDAYMVGQDNILTYKQFTELFDAYEPLFDDIFKMQLAFRSSIMENHFWYGRAQRYGASRSKILPTSDVPADDSRNTATESEDTKDRLALLPQKSLRNLKRQPTLRDLNT